MAGRRASKIIESSDEEMDGVRLEEPQNTSNRRKFGSPHVARSPANLYLAPRGAKEKASQGECGAYIPSPAAQRSAFERAAWSSLIPASKSDKADKESGEYIEYTSLRHCILIGQRIMKQPSSQSRRESHMAAPTTLRRTSTSMILTTDVPSARLQRRAWTIESLGVVR